MNETINFDNFAEEFFKVMAKRQSYLNFVYLLLSFPLGIFYFVFFVAGLSLGIGLLALLIGIPILLLMLMAVRGLTAFEHKLAVKLLYPGLAPLPAVVSGPGLWPRLKAQLLHVGTWKGLAYLLAKFPFGILAFVTCVISISLTLTLLAAPLTYQFTTIHLGIWRVDTMDKALVCSLLGFLVGLISLHLINSLTFLWGCFARLMLGGSGQSIQGEVKVGQPVLIP